jgi:hypothetical protein
VHHLAIHAFGLIKAQLDVDPWIGKGRAQAGQAVQCEGQVPDEQRLMEKGESRVVQA